MLKLLICFLIALGATQGFVWDIKCMTVFCTMDLKICPDGRPAPVAPGECCPSFRACFLSQEVFPMSRSLPTNSLLSNGNLLQTLVGATHNSDLATALSILKLLNNVQQLSNDVHQIPSVINETLSTLVGGAGQAGQIVVDQLVGAVNAMKPSTTSRNLLAGLGQNVNMLSSVSQLLPPGTSIATVISILKLLNNINALNSDIHQIPVVLNETLTTLLGGAGQASQIVIQQLMGLAGVNTVGTSRNLLAGLGQNVNMLSSVSQLLPPGTSIATVISILKLLNNINALNSDIHQIPVVLNETLTTLLGGAGQASQIVIQQLMGLAGINADDNGRNLLGALGQNMNTLSTLSGLLPQGTSISTVLSLLNLLNNVNAISTNLQQLPTLLQGALQGILSGVQNILPTY